jgi:hypothetical protein
LVCRVQGGSSLLLLLATSRAAAAAAAAAVQPRCFTSERSRAQPVGVAAASGELLPCWPEPAAAAAYLMLCRLCVGRSRKVGLDLVTRDQGGRCLNVNVLCVSQTITQVPVQPSGSNFCSADVAGGSGGCRQIAHPMWVAAASCCTPGQTPHARWSNPRV